VATSERTFLVDSYVPGVDVTTAHELADRLCLNDHRLRWLCALAIPAEETITCVVSASEPHEVVDLLRSAGLSIDHVTEVVLLAP
jgi:hypothetical protein